CWDLQSPVGCVHKARQRAYFTSDMLVIRSFDKSYSCCCCNDSPRPPGAAKRNSSLPILLTMASQSTMMRSNAEAAFRASTGFFRPRYLNSSFWTV
uniref:Uncharacterized protein n=1 Tax=Salmo trutta TaxID=8032 RepID=A0A674DEF1_SALTR